MRTYDHHKSTSKTRFAALHVVLAAAVVALLASPLASAGASSGPVATKSASLRQQVKSLTKRLAAVEARLATTAQIGGPTTATPVGPAGGDLTGTYPNPKIGANTVTGANVQDHSLSGLDIVPNTIFGTEIGQNSVFADDLGTDSVGTSELMPVHEVVGPGADIAANGTGTSTVTCPPNEMLIAGGYAWQSIQ